MVKTLASGAEVSLAARVQTPVGVEVAATLTILQILIIFFILIVFTDCCYFKQSHLIVVSFYDFSSLNLRK